jgi:RimJ/RimL family protein N-acetyltransferase/cell wall assembly regulator SMI1
MTILETARLTLRPCTPADRADFIALERDPDVMRFLNGGIPVDQEDGGTDGPFMMPRGTEPHLWTARRKESERAAGGHGAGGKDGVDARGAFVGWFCLWPEGGDAVAAPSQGGTAELGYRLARAAWGQGFATEGAAALIAWGFRAQGYATITAETMAANAGSRRVMEKLGMCLVRTAPSVGPAIPGSELGDVWYAVTRGEWEAALGRQPIPGQTTGSFDAGSSGGEDGMAARGSIDGAFEPNPGIPDNALSLAMKDLGVELPEDYQAFLRKTNGGAGFLGEAYVSLWRGEELKQKNEDYQVAEFAPGLLIFGSDGGGEAYAFDMHETPWKVVQVPFIGMRDADVAWPMGSSFTEFLKKVAEDDDL